MADLETRLLIGGEQVAGDGAAIEVENPFTEETIATVGAPSAEQLDAAIARRPRGLDGVDAEPGRAIAASSSTRSPTGSRRGPTSSPR